MCVAGSSFTVASRLARQTGLCGADGVMVALVREVAAHPVDQGMIGVGFDVGTEEAGRVVHGDDAGAAGHHDTQRSTVVHGVGRAIRGPVSPMKTKRRGGAAERADRTADDSYTRTRMPSRMRARRGRARLNCRDRSF